MGQRVAIVGVAESDQGKVPHVNAMELHVQAAKRAIADAGMSKDEIDGLFTTGGRYGMMPIVAQAEYMGLFPSYLEGTNIGGGAWELMVGHAANAVAAGLCKTALVVYGAAPLNDPSEGIGQAFSAPGTPVAYDDPFGLPLPARAALVASRHMHLYGTTSRQLAEVAVATRKNAGLNPYARFRDPITIDDVLNSRMIADPLHLLDCCVVTNGGGAVIITTEDRAKDLPKKPIYIMGYGEALASETMAGWPDWGRMCAVESGKRAYAQAKVGPSDIDLLQLYDAFTINVLLQLEALGFCKEGESGAFVEGGRLAYDGALPTNTDGGGLSSNHPGMRGIFLVIEAVRQMRGERGAARVAKSDIVLCNGTGGPFSSSSTVILGKDA